MKPYDSLPLSPKDSSDDLGEEDDSFLPESEKTILSRNRSPTIHFAILYTIIVVLFTGLVSEPKWRPKCHDPSLGLYCMLFNHFNNIVVLILTTLSQLLLKK